MTLMMGEGYETGEVVEGKMRTFDTGATRGAETDKLDFEGFISPFALERYAQYLNEHRTQADGKQRASDNWQKGIPRDEYIKSLIRHAVEAWKAHRVKSTTRKFLQDALCGIIFNAMGYLHEDIKDITHLSKPKLDPEETGK